MVGPSSSCLDRDTAVRCGAKLRGRDRMPPTFPLWEPLVSQRARLAFLICVGCYSSAARTVPCNMFTELLHFRDVRLPRSAWRHDVGRVLYGGGRREEAARVEEGGSVPVFTASGCTSSAVRWGTFAFRVPAVLRRAVVGLRRVRERETFQRERASRELESTQRVLFCWCESSKQIYRVLLNAAYAGFAGG